MRVAITGSTGLIGQALTQSLLDGGHVVQRVVRDPVAAIAGAILWSPDRGPVDPDELDGLDAVVHLAGEPMGARRWTEQQKARIRKRPASRVTKAGLLRVTAQRHRSQAANRKLALERFTDLLREALHEEAPRRPTGSGISGVRAATARRPVRQSSGATCATRRRWPR